MPPMGTRFPVPVGPNSHPTEGAPLPGANETLFLAPVGPRRATNGTLSAAPGPSQPARGQPAPNPQQAARGAVPPGLCARRGSEAARHGAAEPADHAAGRGGAGGAPRASRRARGRFVGSVPGAPFPPTAEAGAEPNRAAG